MNIVVILGSHRLGGTNGEIEEMLKELDTNHTFDFIHLAEKRVEGLLLYLWHCFQLQEALHL